MSESVLARVAEGICHPLQGRGVFLLCAAAFLRLLGPALISLALLLPPCLQIDDINLGACTPPAARLAKLARADLDISARAFILFCFRGHACTCRP